MARLRGTSKIAPHEFDSLPELLKAMFEIFDDHDFPFSYLTFIWLVLIGVRTIGSIADAQVHARPKTEMGRNPSHLSAQSPPAANFDRPRT